MIVYPDKFEDCIKQKIDTIHAILLHGTATDAIRRGSQCALKHVLGDPKDYDRLTELSATDLKSDPACLDEAIRARSFFPGRRVVHVMQATDSLASIILPYLETMQSDDALLVVSAGKLTKTSTLRKAFEGKASYISTPFYDENQSPLQIQKQLRTLCAPVIGDLSDASQQLSALPASQVDQVIQILNLAALDGEAVDLDKYLPNQTEADFFEVIQAVLQRDGMALQQHYKVLTQRRQSLVTLIILLSKEIQGLLKLRALPSQQLEQKLRTSYFGARQKAVRSALPLWKEASLIKLLQNLHKIDLELRSTSHIDKEIFVLRNLMRACQL